ncbi:MAG: fibronectin type III domain-containing protein, partial [Lachnospiraceae bacterium]|nr:fibronectin type III domain-containing protein [Lachnospiraceae bacterium]
MSIVGESHTVYNEKNLTGTSYTSKSNLEDGKQYRVSVVAYGSHTSIDSEGKTILIRHGFYDPEPLAVPQKVKATATATSVIVSFSAVSRATGYDILFDNVVYSVTSTSKSFTGLKAGTTHTYAVRAKNSIKTGEYSSTQSIMTTAQGVTVPVNIKKTATETSATISWGAVSGATGYDIQFNGTTYAVSSTSRTFTGLVAGRAYSFAVRAKNANSTGAYTTQLTVTTPPKAPMAISATSTSNSVTLNWDAVSGATGYIVRFNNTDYHVSAPAASKTITGLAQKTSYSYQICCKSADGSGAYGASRSITTQVQAPAVPANIRKTATERSVTISWNAVSGATGYDLVFNGTAYNVSGTSKTITGLTANRSYSFKVGAKNGSVAGNFTSEMTVTTPPAAPSSTSATC